LGQQGQLLLVPLAGQLFVLERTGHLTFRTHRLPVEGVTDPKLSPDGRYVAFIKDHDVHVCEWQRGRAFAVTTGGSDARPHGAADFGPRGEMGPHPVHFWPPDSQHIVYQEPAPAGVERLHIADPARPYRSPDSWFYPRAGQKNAQVRLGVVKVSP